MSTEKGTSSTLKEPLLSNPSLEKLKDELRKRVKSWKSSLPDYCAQVLTLKNKVGQLVPAILNRSQLHLHHAIEDQLQRIGMVRALVLKGRQQGISTYVQARFYWKTSLSRGLKAYILTHRTDASDNLFEIAERYYKLSVFRPHLGACNAKELVFDQLDSGYQVATAGSEGTGRSGTAQLFHGSEVAFWPQADSHLSGIGQVVAKMPGTEIILESTANGIGNVFHRLWQAAERKESDFIPVFLPWFWEPGYTAAVLDGFALSDEDEKYRSTHGLTLGQMAWRREKIASDFLGDPNRFAQEYPATAEEAFVAVGHDPFIPPPIVAAAMKRRDVPSGILIVGVDPARFGDNETCIARRRGRQCAPIERLKRRDTMHQVGRLAMLIRDEKPARVFIDIGGLGAGVYDRLVELGYGDVVTAVNFGGVPGRTDRYVNKRAEMWGDLRDWLPLAELPDDTALAGELSAPGYKYDSESRIQLEKKEDMRKRGIRSPDSADALALTFAMPVAHATANTPGGRAWEDMVDACNSATGERGGEYLEGVHTG